MTYWNPLTPINVPSGTVTLGPQPPQDALTRIAAALERIAYQFEVYNAKHSVTVTTTAKKPVIHKAKARRRG